MKVMSHELRGASWMFLTSFPHIRVPLTAVIDYLGFRVVAEAIVPIHSRTLIQGM